jgi:hypothetical protein
MMGDAGCASGRFLMEVVQYLKFPNNSNVSMITPLVRFVKGKM